MKISQTIVFLTLKIKGNDNFICRSARIRVCKVDGNSALFGLSSKVIDSIEDLVFLKYRSKNCVDVTRLRERFKERQIAGKKKMT